MNKWGFIAIIAVALSAALVGVYMHHSQVQDLRAQIEDLRARARDAGGHDAYEWYPEADRPADRASTRLGPLELTVVDVTNPGPPIPSEPDPPGAPERWSVVLGVRNSGNEPVASARLAYCRAEDTKGDLWEPDPVFWPGAIDEYGPVDAFHYGTPCLIGGNFRIPEGRRPVRLHVGLRGEGGEIERTSLPLPTVSRAVNAATKAAGSSS